MTLQTKKYVLGLAFWNNYVALINKTKGPEYVIDTWNGIGGKIDPSDFDNEYAAMAREFKEETGVRTHPSFWKSKAVQRGKSWNGPDYELNILYGRFKSEQVRPDIENLEGDGEIVRWFNLNNLPPTLTPNLSWIIPLVLDETTGFLDIKERT